MIPALKDMQLCYEWESIMAHGEGRRNGRCTTLIISCVTWNVLNSMRYCLWFVLNQLKSQMLLKSSNITGYHSNRDLSMKYKRPLWMDAWALKVQRFKSHRHGKGDPCSARASPWTVTPTLSWNRDLLEILNGPYETWVWGVRGPPKCSGRSL